MFSADRVVTDADKAISESMCNSELSWFGRNLKLMLGECQRTTPFSTTNVVARVTLLSTIGVYALCAGNHTESYDVISTLHRFAKGKIGWTQFVESCCTIHKEMDLSEAFCNDALCYFRGHATFFMTFIEWIPGDLDIAEGSSRAEDFRQPPLYLCAPPFPPSWEAPEG